MNKRARIATIFIYGVFICYIILLVKILFLSRVSITGLFDSQRILSRSVNLIPFDTIFDYLSSGSEMMKQFAFGNVAGNIIIFVPLGSYLMYFKKNKRVITNLLYIFISSVLVETLQWAFGIGASDIDDVILNSLGGCIGILGYKLLSLILQGDRKMRITVTILSAIGLPVLLYYLLFTRMRF